MKKLLSLAVLTAPLLLAACGATPSPNANELTTADTTAVEFTPVVFDPNPYLNQNLATAGSYTILGRDFVYNLRNNMAQAEEFYRWMAQMSDEDPTPMIEAHWAEIGEDGYSNLELVRQETLLQTKERALMLILAKEAGMTYDNADLQETLDSLQVEIMELEAQGVDAHHLFYQLFGVTLADYEYLERERLIGLAFIQHLTEQAIIDDTTVDQFIHDNPSLLMQHVQVPQDYIDQFVADNPSAPVQLARAFHVLVENEAFAEELLNRINAGEDISALAETYTQDPGSLDTTPSSMRPEGTPLGMYIFPRGVMVTGFEDFAFDQPAGATGIVPSQFGYHVMLNDGLTYGDPDPNTAIQTANEQFFAHATTDELWALVDDSALANIRTGVRENLAMDEAFDQIMAMVEARTMNWTVDEAVLAELH